MTDDLPEEVDPRLWFTTAGCTSSHYLVEGNSGILGRMYFYCPLGKVTTRVSKADIDDSSDEVRYFIKGFLSGSEPRPPLDADGLLVDDEAAVSEWRDATTVWRETGAWPRNGD